MKLQGNDDRYMGSGGLPEINFHSVHNQPVKTSLYCYSVLQYSTCYQRILNQTLSHKHQHTGIEIICIPCIVSIMDSVSIQWNSNTIPIDQ